MLVSWAFYGESLLYMVWFFFLDEVSDTRKAVNSKDQDKYPRLEWDSNLQSQYPSGQKLHPLAYSHWHLRIQGTYINQLEPVLKI
jgi:hypothetical protein